MRQIPFLLALTIVAAAVVFTARASRRINQDIAPIFVTEIKDRDFVFTRYAP